MISNEIIQADLLAAIKADADLIAALPSAGSPADYVKEAQYAGEDFRFPAIRLKMMRQLPETNRGHCDHARLTFSVYVLTEGGSSREASVLAGLVNAIFHGPDGKFFRGNSDPAHEWTAFFRSAGLMPPLRTGQRLWQSEASFRGMVYPA